MHHDHPIGEQVGVERVVADDHGRAPGERSRERLPHLAGHGDVKRGQRLVEQQQPGFGGEGAGHGDPLRLPAGQLVGAAVGERLHTNGAQPAIGDAPRVDPGCASGPRTELHVLPHGQVREQQRLLREQSHAAAVRRGPGAGQVEQHVVAERRPAGVGADEPGEHPEHGGLACAVRAEHGDGLTVRDAEVDVGPALGQRRAHLDGGVDAVHRAAACPGRRADPPTARSRRRPGSPAPCATATTTTATAISTSESATAASGSVSRCR